MSRDVQLVDDLVRAVPEFEEYYTAHVENQHGVLPYVFLTEVVWATVDSFLDAEPDLPDWRETLRFLEEQLAGAEPEVHSAIVTAFLYQLPFPGERGHELLAHLGPVLSANLAAIRPNRNHS